MTPSALTPAARGNAKKSSPGRPAPSSATQHGARAARSAGHPSEVRRPVAPRTARRVSGPLGGLTRGRAQTAPSPPTRPGVSRPKRAVTRNRAPWPARTAAYVRGLPDHALLDRIIRGRAWIPLLGVLLVGIVAMQVEVLKLNAGIGRSLDRASALQGQNQLLRASVSQLSDEQRIERLAASQGMIMAAPAEIKFLATGAAVDQRALTSVHQPDATSFAAQLAAANGAALAASAQAGATSSTPSTAGAVTGADTSGTAVTTAVSTGASSAGTAGTGTTGTAAATATSTSPVTTQTADSGATQSPSTPPVTPAGAATGAGTGTGSAAPAAGAPQQSSAGTSGAPAGSGGVSATPTGN